MTVKLFTLIILLSVESFAIDFTTIGQKEIVDYIKNRADILYGAKLSERNRQDLLSNAVFTGLEEEALTFEFGKSTSSEPIDVDNKPKNLLDGLASLVSDSETDSVPLKIFLTSDSQGTTNIQMATLTTTKSSSSKQSVGDFVVTSVQSENNDVTNLDGSITINLGGSTDSHNLTLMKTVYIAAEIKVTTLGSEWDENLLKNDRKLLSLMPSTTGSLYQVEYQSLIRETITSNDGDVFVGVKTSGNVLVHKTADGVLSLAGRLIYGKIEPTLADEAEELVDKFLTINGSKSRQFFIKDNKIVAAKSDLISEPNAMKSTVSKSNLISGGSFLLNYMRKFLNPQRTYYKENGRSQDHGNNWNHNSRGWHERSRDDPYSWHSHSWHSHSGHSRSGHSHSGHSSHSSEWRKNWEHKYNYKYEWNWNWNWNKYERSNSPDKQIKSTTQAPIPSTSSTPKPKPEPVVVATTAEPLPLVTTRQPKVTTPPTEPETFAPTTETVEHVEVTSTVKPTLPELTEPELPPLPKGTTVSLWSSIIIQ